MGFSFFSSPFSLVNDYYVEMIFRGLLVVDIMELLRDSEVSNGFIIDFWSLIGPFLGIIDFVYYWFYSSLFDIMFSFFANELLAVILTWEIELIALAPEIWDNCWLEPMDPSLGKFYFFLGVLLIFKT